ncbi:MAG: hypothetical protein CMM50_04555 [Rhodospirillaceae bacterium]|nr:hypothetical protein [Rhodospirillaceae bacterium]
MKMKTTENGAPAVLALIALLFNVFLPFFVAPIGASTDEAGRPGAAFEAQLIPLCTMQGPQWLPVDGKQDGDTPQRPLGPGCCVLCPYLLLHAKLIAPAPVPVPGPARRLAGSCLRPPPSLHRQAAGFHRRPLRPRTTAHSLTFVS